MSKRKNKPYKTPYRHSSGKISNRDINTRRNSISKDVPFTLEAYSRGLKEARAFDADRRFIYAYQLIVYAWDEENKHEVSVTIQTLRDIYYLQNDAAHFEEMREELKNTLHRSGNYQIRFMRFVFVLDKENKNAFIIERQTRSEKQKAGRQAAERERRLLAKEERERKARNTRKKKRQFI